mmetsp:Transcript_130816/g.419561  ORF Transcript_130816/g.419561 Transcript_130816/m.419561 type:complete len:209 (-) Transcript_130816:59-685(-)
MPRHIPTQVLRRLCKRLLRTRRRSHLSTSRARLQRPRRPQRDTGSLPRNPAGGAKALLTTMRTCTSRACLSTRWTCTSRAAKSSTSRASPTRACRKRSMMRAFLPTRRTWTCTSRVARPSTARASPTRACRRRSIMRASFSTRRTCTPTGAARSSTSSTASIASARWMLARSLGRTSHTAKLSAPAKKAASGIRHGCLWCWGRGRLPK